MPNETQSAQEYKIVDSIEALDELIERVKAAQKEFSTFSQEKVSKRMDKLIRVVIELYQSNLMQLERIMYQTTD